jgi:AcrR family transcriptional regulator
VRAALIDAAAHLIAEKGMARLTVDAVAKAAGVTKGGLFHHFATKDDLVQGVLDAMFAFANERIGAAMADDPEPHGRFTRAYLNGVFEDAQLNGKTSSRTLCLSMLADPNLQASWSDWVDSQIAHHAETDDNPQCALVRLAADGAWLNSLKHPGTPPPLPADIYRSLIDLTKPPS